MNCWETFLVTTDRLMMDFLICRWPRPREGKYIVDEVIHALGIGADDIEQSDGFLIKIGRVSGHQQPGKTLDGSQRGLEVMGHRIGEGFQFLVGGFQLGRTFSHPLLQFLIKPANLLFRLSTFGFPVHGFHGEGQVLRPEEFSTSISSG